MATPKNTTAEPAKATYEDERRYLKFEVRMAAAAAEAAAEGEAAPAEAQTRTIVGHAALFNDPTEIYWFRETILPGAFTEAIGTSDIRALFNHDPNHLLGRTSSGTLKVYEDERGLAIELTVPEHRQDIIEMIERGDLTQMSFGFRVKEDKWTYNDDEQLDERVIIKVEEIFDVSPVTFPAYRNTDISLRSYQEYRSAKKSHTEAPPEEPVKYPELDRATRTLKLINSKLKTHLQ